MLNIHIITLFPKVFDEYLKTSIVGRAIGEKKIKIFFYNPIDFSTDKHKRVDDRPYGGGPGMVLQAEPFLRAFDKAKGRKKARAVFFTPSGKQFNTKVAKTFADEKNLILICGHYEGIDERVVVATESEKISVSDAVLTGGELPALFVIDAVSRFIPGVLGNEQSIEENRIAGDRVYTRPENIKYKKKKFPVPKVLLSGHHKEIDIWRKGKGVAKK